MAFLGTNKRRLAKVREALATCPIPAATIEGEFVLFRHEGTLPEDERLAALVGDRAQHGHVRAHDPAGRVTHTDLDAVILQTLQPRGPSTGTAGPTVREALFDEAVHGPEVVRRWARIALRVLVSRGGDVTDHRLGADRGFPDYGTVGMHVLGYPRRLATAPYEEQGRRLFDRYDEIRRRLDLNPDDDFGPMAEAFLAFEERGELPGDGLLREYVLAEFEIEMLWEHRRGRDVSTVMALLDRVSTATSDEREAAVAEVQRLVQSPSA
jgi:hypothetical protein